MEILSAGSKVVSCSCHSMSLGGEWPYLASDCKLRTFHNMPWCRPIGEMALQSRVPMSRLIQTTQASSCGVAASGTRCAGGVWLVCSGVPRRRNEVEELSRCDNHTGGLKNPINTMTSVVSVAVNGPSRIIRRHNRPPSAIATFHVTSQSGFN